MSDVVGTCRFCGQTVIIEDGKDMTDPQKEEYATRHCDCEQAVAYTAAAEREQKAINRVHELFGENSGENRQSEATLKILEDAVKQVNQKNIKEVNIVISTGFKASVKAMAKDKIKVSRKRSESDEYEQ